MNFSDLGIKEQPDKIRYATICPHCNDSRQKHKNVPCLTVNNEEGNRWFKCNHCLWSGNLDIYEKYDKVREKSYMPKQFPEVYSQEVMAYWKRRGIDYKIALKERVYEFQFAKRPALGFPVYQNQTLVNVKFLNIRWQHGDDGTKWWQLPKSLGTKILPWGLNTIEFEKDKPRVVVHTEGEIDRLTWLTAGYKNIISEPQGAPSLESTDFKDKFAYVEDPYFKNIFKDVQKIIFSTDGDEPGKKLRNHLALLLGKERCKFINYPVGYKDINEVWAGDEKKGLKALGQEGVDECYQNLSSFPVKGIITPQDVRDELKILSEEGFKPGLGIGVPEIDRLFTLKPKHITFLTGTPSAGKSVFTRWYITELIKHNDKQNLKWGWFSPENRPVGREIAKIAEVITGQYYKKGWGNSMSDDLRDKTVRFIAKHFFIISPDRKNYETWGDKIDANRMNTMDSILYYLTYLKKTEDIFGFIIDAWNKVEHEQPKYIPETTFISQQLDRLIDFCDYNNVHGWVIVHPRKIEQQGVNYKMPSLYDIKGSSAWKEKADIGIILHRYTNKKKKKGEIPEGADDDDKYYVDQDAPTILRTEKIRFEETGVMDRIKLRMDCKKGGRFYVVDADKEKQQVADVAGKLNPHVSDEEEDDVFNGVLEDKKLPF